MKYWTRKVYQYSLDGKFINLYYGYKNASRETGIKIYSIYSASNGHNKTAGGYIWEKSKKLFRMKEPGV